MQEQDISVWGQRHPTKREECKKASCDERKGSKGHHFQKGCQPQPRGPSSRPGQGQSECRVLISSAAAWALSAKPGLRLGAEWLLVPSTGFQFQHHLQLAIHVELLGFSAVKSMTRNQAMLLITIMFLNSRTVISISSLINLQMNPFLQSLKEPRIGAFSIIFLLPTFKTQSQSQIALLLLVNQYGLCHFKSAPPWYLLLLPAPPLSQRSVHI